MRRMFLWPVVLLLLHEKSSSVQASHDQRFTHSIEREFDELFNVIMKKVMPLASDLVASAELSPACSGSLMKTFLGLRLKEPWALRIALANGFLPTNLLEGSFVNLGSYEQCLKTNVFALDGSQYFKGQYCTLFANPPWDVVREMVPKFQAYGQLKGRYNPLTLRTDTRMQHVDFRLGICMPSVCNSAELNFLANGALNRYGVNATVTGCRTNDPKVPTPLQAFVMTFLTFLGFLVAAGTFAVWYSGKNLKGEKGTHGIALKILSSFCLSTNTEKLLDTHSKGEASDRLLFLNGFRLILCYWVTLFHAYIIVQPEFYHSGFKVFELGDKVYFQLVTNAFLSISTVFYLSGFKLCYEMIHKRDSVLKQNSFALFLVVAAKRYIRLTAPMLLVVLATFLLPLFADGPADQELFAQEIRSCLERWWTVVIHTNNLSPLHRTCLSHLWFVSTEIQIFLIVALPITLLLIRYPRTSLIIAAVLAILCSILTTLRTYYWNLFFAVTTGTNDGLRIFQTLEFVYFRPLTHVATYMCGIICGYIAVVHRKVPIHPILQAVLWVGSLSLTSFVVFVTLPWNRGYLPGDVINALYGGFHRLVWSAGLSWPIYACATGRGGVLARILGWKAFKPLAKLAYGVYLIHGVLLLLRMGCVKSRFNLDEYFQLTNALGILFFSYVLSYLLYVVCDAPIAHLVSMIPSVRWFRSTSEAAKAPGTTQNNTPV
ncbi:nose resistant to fluoxetine protein 6-like [Ornithodoros turicata]|uniref:nose resistant to fluoxetine protein 6-like n=1 Tax=Ornithodoros turicata TaxID=34597 RepID=UPI003138C216